MKSVLIDACVTLKPEKEVVKYYTKLLKYFGGINPFSNSIKAKEALKIVRTTKENLAKLINVNPNRIFLTSSGTEANNFAIKGFLMFNKNKISQDMTVLTTNYEHSSTEFPLRTMSSIFKFNILKFKIKNNFLEELNSIIQNSSSVFYACLGLANLEIGRIYPVEEIIKKLKSINKEIVVHCNACSIAGRMKIDNLKLNADMISISAHKFSGILGVGALYVKPGIRMFPLIEGGLEEDGMRGGFYNIPALGAVSLATQIALDEMDERNKKILMLKKYFYDRMNLNFNDKIKWISDINSEINFHTSFIIKDMNFENLILKLNENKIELSNYSLCNNAGKIPNALLDSGISYTDSLNYVRICLSYYNLEKEIDRLIKVLNKIFKNSKKES